MKRGGGRLVTAVVVGVIGTAAVGCGASLQARRPAAAERSAVSGVTEQPQAAEPAGYAGLDEVPERLAPDGTTIVVGDPQAKITVHLFEDARCPVCQEFEVDGAGPTLTEWTVRRGVKVEYTMASFLDGRLGGHGSRKAVNALRAALEEGKFAEYHAVLYRYQPPEEEDGFTDARLLELAGRVEGLRTPAFEAAVRTMKYQDFVDASEKVFARAGHYNGHEGPGTPTAEINGMRVPAEYNGLLFDKRIMNDVLTRVRDSL